MRCLKDYEGWLNDTGFCDYLLVLINATDKNENKDGWIVGWDLPVIHHECIEALTGFGFMLELPDYQDRIMYYKVTLLGRWHGFRIKKKRCENKKLYQSY